MCITYNINNGTLNINFSQKFILYIDTQKKNELFNIINTNNIKNIVITTEDLQEYDSSLTIILYKIIKISKIKNITINIDKIENNLKELIKLAFSVNRQPSNNLKQRQTFFEKLGEKTINYYNSFKSGLFFIYETIKSLKRFCLSKAVYRKVDLYFALEDCTFKALPIVGLINFMVGVILAFVGAIELKLFGAEIYVASLVSISMVRIMGAIMVGIIMSGRTGASYSATIGTMQVNDEVDALKTMGFSIIDFLLLPRIISLVITVPILTIFAEIIGILGGASVGILALNLPSQEYFKMSINILSLNHFLIGLFHSFIFGIIISICGCYYGINCKKDADSVGKSTTMAVVSSIIWIIIATGIITVLCEVFNI